MYNLGTLGVPSASWILLANSKVNRFNLYLIPLVVRCCDKAALPEDLVQFYYWKRCDLAQPRR